MSKSTFPDEHCDIDKITAYLECTERCVGTLRNGEANPCELLRRFCFGVEVPRGHLTNLAIERLEIEGFGEVLVGAQAVLGIDHRQSHQADPMFCRPLSNVASMGDIGCILKPVMTSPGPWYAFMSRILPPESNAIMSITRITIGGRRSPPAPELARRSARSLRWARRSPPPATGRRRDG